MTDYELKSLEYSRDTLLLVGECKRLLQAIRKLISDGIIVFLVAAVIAVGRLFHWW